MELPEDGRDGASQGLGLRARIEPGQPLGDQGQELPGDLPGPPVTARKAVTSRCSRAPSAETVYRAGWLWYSAMVVTRTSRGAEEQVPIVGQIAAAGDDRVHRQVDPLRDHVLGGPLGKEGVREPVHDGEVVARLGGGDIPVELQTIGIHHLRTLRRGCDVITHAPYTKEYLFSSNAARPSTSWSPREPGADR